MSTLVAGGERSLVSVTDAQAILQRFEETPRPIDTIDLSSRMWPPAAIRPLLPFLTQARPRVLRMVDSIATLPTDQGLETVQLLSEALAAADGQPPLLQVLNADENALGIRGIDCMKAVLSLPTLVELTLYKTGMNADSIDRLVEYFLPSDTVVPALQKLHVGECNLGPEGAERMGERLLPRLKNLSDFAYNGCRPRVEGSRPLCAGLLALHESRASENDAPSFVSINLNDIVLRSGEDNDDPILSFIKVLRSSGELTSLNLANCSMESEGAALVATALSQAAAPVEMLDLSGNDVDAEGIEAVVREYLSLDGTLARLHTLKLADNYFEQAGLDELLPFFQVTPQLKVLDVSENSLEKEALDFFLDNKIASLEILNLANDSIDPEEFTDEVTRLRKQYPTVHMTEAEASGAPPSNAGMDEDAAAVDDLADQIAESQFF